MEGDLRRLLGLLVVVVALVVACGGDSSGSVVESADGLAMLSLPDGSLPDGVSPSDVQLDVVVDESGEPGMPVVLIRLAPDGLVLSAAAELTVAMPGSLHDGAMALHVAGDSVEFLSGELVTHNGTLAFATPIEHFSYVVLFEEPFMEASVKVSPTSVAEGMNQVAEAEVKTTNAIFDVWLPFLSDPEGTLRKLTFSVVETSITLGENRVEWQDAERWWTGETNENWMPSAFLNVLEVEVDGSDFSGWSTGPLTATCLQPNRADVHYVQRIYYEVTLLDRSDTADHRNTVLGELLFSGERIIGGDTQSTGSNLLTIPMPATLPARAWFHASSTSICEGAADSSSSSTTSTTLGDGNDPQGDGKNGESQQVTPEEDVPGADIKSVRHERGPSGENCFIIEVYGDGETAAVDASSYIITIEVVDSDSDGGGWRTLVRFRLGAPEAGDLFIGIGAEAERLEGAEVSVKWTDSTTMKVTVAGAGTALGVESFKVAIVLPDFSDEAEGIGAS